MNYRKLLFVVLIVTSACTTTISSSNKNSLLKEDEVIPLSQASYMTNLYTTFSEDAFYYLTSGGVLFAYDKNGSNIEIGSVNFADDKMIGSSLDGIDTFRRYVDLGMNGQGFLYFDHKLIYESRYENNSGEIFCRLNSISETGDDFQNLLTLDYEPSYFSIQKNRIAISEVPNEDGGSILRIYDLTGEELKNISIDSGILNVISDGDLFVIKSKKSLYSVNIDSLELTMLEDDAYYFYIADGKASYYTVDMPEDFDTTQDTTGIKVHSGIKKYDSNDVLFEMDDVLIDYFDNNYIYTTTLEEEHTKYRIYDWNGNLLHEIIPYDSLGESKNGANEVALKKMEYSAIVKVWNHQIIGSYNGESDIQLFACDIESGSCKYLRY